jgi:hypothetical protein
MCGTEFGGREMSLWVKNCLAISRSGWLFYPTKLPRRPFAIEAVEGQKETFCAAANNDLFDHVGSGEDRLWDGEAQRLGGF